MRALFRIVWDTVKVFILFVGCTALFYFAFKWVEQEYENYHRYDSPKGRAVEVYQAGEEESGFQWLERLKLFYQVGE
ncbi:MAG TPA: YqzK family protein [Bacillales bacterium]|nr:YqzK family protein [Bacillales bacterium]